MEFKTLSDQLNSACEEYFGVSQANGLPLQDDLYQGKSIEPQFQGGLRYGKTGHCLSFSQPIVKDNVEKIVERLKKMDTSGQFDHDYELGEYSQKQNSFVRCALPSMTLYDFEIIDYEDDNTLVYFDGHQDHDGRRFWIFGLCNCKKDSGNCEGGERRCLRVSITWKKEREHYAKMFGEVEGYKKKARELYEYFECKPQCKTAKLANFEKEWMQIQKSKFPTEESSTSSSKLQDFYCPL
eukprot:GHVP01068769.1.p1 GENE.GHVP01068769.1~~GHVP01068769.1.p1  ORF type:complete len:247 (+),score=29.26 GHVP01068769.1:27-743(+)